MPYSISNPPDRISALPKHAKEIWIAAFNAAIEEYKDEGRANATAWSAVEKAGYINDAAGEWHKENRMNISELFEKVRNIFDPLLETVERIKDVASWDGSASRYSSTEAYCKACLINLNTGEHSEWTQANCKLPVKDTDGQPVRQAIHAAAAAITGARGGVDAPDEDKKSAANALLDYYSQMKEDAPVSLYQVAGKTPHQRSTEYLPTQTREFTVTRTKDGKSRWLMIAASAVINKAGAIDSTALFDNFIRRANETGAYPILDFYHEGERIRFGVADWLRRDGALYLASGTFDDTHIGRSASAGLESQPAKWGASISYKPTVEPLTLVGEGEIPIYTDGINNFISIVKTRMAANLFTATISTKEVKRMDKKIYEDLVELVGEEAAKPFKSLVDDANRTITETGMVTRSAEVPTTLEGGEGNQGGANTQDKPEERQDLTALEEQIKALAERVSKLEQALAGQEQMNESIEKRSVDTLTEIGERLKKVEESKERWDEWQAGLPDQHRDDTTYRGRGNTTEHLMSPADVAAQTMQKVNARHR